MTNGNAAVHGRRPGTAQVTTLRLAPATVGPAGAPGPLPPDRRDAVFRRLLATADIVAAAGGIMCVGLLNSHGVQLASLATVPLIIVMAKLTGRYDHDEVVLRKSTLDEVPRLLTLAAGYALAWSLVAFAFGLQEARSDVIVLWSVTALLLILCRAAARAVGQHSTPTERVLIVGGSAARARIARRLAAEPTGRSVVVGYLPLEDERRSHDDWGPKSRRRRNLRVDDLKALVHELDVKRVIVIPTSADPETMLDAISSAIEVGVKVSVVPRIFEVVGSSVEFDEVGGTTLLGVKRPGLTRSSKAIKRTMDIAGALLGMVVLAPFAALVALLIKLDSRGPVFFLQPRVGRDGRTFMMVKFRSMVDGADAQRAALEELNESEGLFKLTADPRITRVGAILRRASLDELPQLLNVLRGEMSLVGPRPLVPEEDRRVEGRHRNRLQLTPGMTGPWQVLGPTRAPLSEMVKIDYLYQSNWSLWYDAKILLRTFAHVLGQRGV
jgi:exopolysaccharide biosynthesis polyprenyl glycosylphosphotransferase